MLSKGFKVVSPKTFEIYYSHVEAAQDEALIKMDLGAICKADLRYFLGLRDEKILGLKYPMRLLHEMVGTVLKSPTDTLKVGDRVVLVPNIANCSQCEKGSKKCSLQSTIGENYCPRAKFASSNLDGFSCEYMSFPISNIVKLPEEVPMEHGVFAELTSVALAALRRCKVDNHKVIAVWGDGIVGYILTSVLRVLTDSRLIIIGKNPEKLELFPADKAYLVGDNHIKEEDITLAFECVGGQGSQYAVDEIMSLIDIGGQIVLTGVAENNIEINTRKILEKGLSITGSTRSSVEDFKKSIKLLENAQYREYISKLIRGVAIIRNIHDYYEVFEEATNPELGKKLLKFNI